MVKTYKQCPSQKLQNPLNWYEWSLDGPLQNEDFVYSQKMLGYTT